MTSDLVFSLAPWRDLHRPVPGGLRYPVIARLAFPVMTGSQRRAGPPLAGPSRSEPRRSEPRLAGARLATRSRDATRGIPKPTRPPAHDR